MGFWINEYIKNKDNKKNGNFKRKSFGLSHSRQCAR
jgi:hypothetical protein